MFLFFFFKLVREGAEREKERDGGERGMERNMNDRGANRNRQFSPISWIVPQMFLTAVYRPEREMKSLQFNSHLCVWNVVEGQLLKLTHVHPRVHSKKKLVSMEDLRLNLGISIRSAGVPNCFFMSPKNFQKYHF